VLLEKLAIFEDEIAVRQRIAARYCERLRRRVRVPEIQDGLTTVWAAFTVRLPAGVDRDEIAVRLKAAGVPTAIYYAKPLHRQTANRDYPVAGNGLPVSERMADEVLSLPIHPYLTEAVQDRIVAAVEAVLG
jgi:dTDP-4-amino-4,6-dideoxygalactose transaminase